MIGSVKPALRTAPRSAALIGALLLILAACGSPATTVPPTEAPTATAGTAAEPPMTIAPTTAATPVPAATSVPTAVPTLPPPTAVPSPTAPPPTAAPAIGVALLVGDQQLMTVLAAEEWLGAPGVKPAKGKAFFTVSIRIDALALTSWDSADFKVRDADRGYAWRTGRSPHLYDGANMTVGNNYIGWITYEVPKASVSRLTLVYKPAFLDGATFRVPLFQ